MSYVKGGVEARTTVLEGHVGSVSMVVGTTSQTAGLTVGSPILFSTPDKNLSSDVTFLDGVFTLKTAGRYLLRGGLYSITGTEVILQWRNITTNTLIGNAINLTNTYSGRSMEANAVLTATASTTVRLEIIYVNGLTGITVGNYGRRPWATIQRVS